MNLVDEENRVLVLLDLLHHLLQALLEVAAIAGAGEQRAHVEGEHCRVLEHLRNVGVDDLARQALGDRRLADARIADQKRIVLLASAQDLDRALHLRLAADQRIDAPVPRLAVEVDAISIERAFLFLRIAAVSFVSFDIARLVLLVGAARQARRIRMAGPLGDAVADVIHRVVTGHVLLLQEKGGMRFALGENGDEHVGAGHFLAPGRLDMEGGALHDPLEAVGRLGLLLAFDDQVFQFRIEIVDDRLAQANRGRPRRPA